MTKIKTADETLVHAISEQSIGLLAERDMDALLERVGDSRIVMLGEASHGTEEFYSWRRYISQRLIREHGFNFIAIEGDWPDAHALNRYILYGEGGNPETVLSQFQRWPSWMWSNKEILRLAAWLRHYNQDHSAAHQTSFFGLDLYSLFESIDAVVRHVKKIDPFLARRVQNRYGCFDTFGRDEIAYARSTLEYPSGCENSVVQNLEEILALRSQGFDDVFDAQQNARIVHDAENYYRAMLRADVNSWNIRDRHMLDTLDLLLKRSGPKSKAIVWAHNTHIGDYRATDMVKDGSVNLGGLAREKFGEKEVVLVGFGTYRGTVTASHAWGGAVQTLNVPAGRPGSYEDLFHQACDLRQSPHLLLIMKKENQHSLLASIRGHRAIGVVYDPEHERWGNYVPTSLAQRYDAFIFVDETSALQPLIHKQISKVLPETWPSGF